MREAGSLAAQRALQNTSVSDAAWPASDWWKSFGDPQLNALIDEALASSPTLNIAAARTRKALAEADAAHSTLAEREQIYALTRDRNAAGLDSRLELKQAESALPATREQIAQLDETIALARNRIAALMGDADLHARELALLIDFVRALGGGYEAGAALAQARDGQ